MFQEIFILIFSLLTLQKHVEVTMYRKVNMLCSLPVSISAVSSALVSKLPRMTDNNFTILYIFESIVFRVMLEQLIKELMNR